MSPRSRVIRCRLIFAGVLLSIFTVSTSQAADYQRLVEQVEIRRTQYGVPHIKGDTLEAVAFGFGYCQAEDHLLNIMHSILRARGELALHFGGEENFESDAWNRQFRVHARAVETYHRLDADFRSMLEGFAAGLNYYAFLNRHDVPAWVPTVSGHDIAAHGLTGVMRFAFNRGNIVREFLREQHEGRPTANTLGDRNADLHGSNMWAFSPERTKSGHAILMGNPHQAWSQVATYYEAHLTVPGKLDFYGSTFVGRPVLTTGWNRNLGWSHTVNYPDLEEIYALALDPERRDHYVFDGGSVPIETEAAEIAVKAGNGADPGTVTFHHTPLGPVIHRDDTRIYVLRSAVYEEFRYYQQWLRMSQAQNFEEFRTALAMQAIPMFNICYADREGNIYYLWNGTVPDLPHEANRAKAVAARRSADVWTRIHGIDELPQLLNPEGGYVQNCNSPPYFTNLYEPLDRSRYPGHFPDNNVSLRSQHSLLLIHNAEKYSLEEVRDNKFSLRMLLADRVKDHLLVALEEAEPDDNLEKAIELLREWDNTVAADSRGGVLFKHWWELYHDKEDGGFAVPWSAEHPISTPRGLNDPGLARRTFGEAMAECRRLYGGWDVAWGEVHRTRQGDVDLPVGGGSGKLGCFRVVAYRRADDNKLIVRGGDSWVFAVEFADTPRAYTIVGYSQSEVEGSPHFNDQARLYAANGMKRAAFSEEEIEEQLIKKYRPGEE